MVARTCKHENCSIGASFTAAVERSLLLEHLQIMYGRAGRYCIGIVVQFRVVLKQAVHDEMSIEQLLPTSLCCLKDAVGTYGTLASSYIKLVLMFDAFLQGAEGRTSNWK